MPHLSRSSGLITQIVSLFCHFASYRPQSSLPSGATNCSEFLLLAVSAGGTELKAKCLKLTDMLDILVESSAVAELQDQ
jgi:hypothetical protein